jgi:predicted MPP superfamily phosphohydrolase
MPVENSYGNASNALHVNRGIGFSLVPIRANARPELTLITSTSYGALALPKHRVSSW